MKESACIQNGKCSSDSLFFSGSQVGEIARCALDTFDRHLNVTMMWTAHNEIEAKWDYVKAWDLTWINKTEVPADKILDYEVITGQKASQEEMTAGEI